MLRNVKTYHKPLTIEDAVGLVHSNRNAVYVGGGAWIVAQGDPQLEVLVDLQKLALDRIDGEIEAVRIGAMTTLQALIDHSDVGTFAAGLLAAAAGFTQSRTLREQGTLGGTLIVAGSADPLTTALLVLDVEIGYADPVRHIAPFESFVAYRDRLIETRALLTGIRVARPPTRSATAFEVVGRSPKDKPIVCVAAYVVVDEGLPVEIRVAAGGIVDHPVRLLKMEHLLKGQLLTAERVEAALAPNLEELNPISDYRGSAEYRLEMVRVLARRAVMHAWNEARRK
ncbi:MAG: FAD binding domain-containing protein [Anaerolineae bacterium]|nr:FAD binding domain-containing protein [Anaerolineae bacterium]